MLVFDLTPDRSTSEDHSSNPEIGHIRLELKFDKALPDHRDLHIVLGIRQFGSRRSAAKRHDRLLMDTEQISCALKDVGSFLGVFLSDLLPHSIQQRQSCTVIINTDPHTESGSHWLAIRFEPRSSRAYYFDSFGRLPHIATIQDFLRRNLKSRIQRNTTTRPHHYTMRPILLSVRPTHGPRLLAETVCLVVGTRQR